MTRKITPHKGGRNKRFPGVRCTQETLDQIAAIVANRTRSDGERYTIADWIAEKAVEDAAKLRKENEK